MRLIATFDTEKQAYTFYSLLLKEGIQNAYESFKDPEQEKRRYRIWIFEEDDLEAAQELLDRFQQNPEDPLFQSIPALLTPPPPPSKDIEKPHVSIHPFLPKRKLPPILTHFIIGICIILFLWNDAQESQMLKEKSPFYLQVALTPIQQNLLYDYPNAFQKLEDLLQRYPHLASYKDVKKLSPEAQGEFDAVEKIPSWKGVYPFFEVVYSQGWEKAKEVPLFEKIRQKEIWRLFTPALLHSGFIHILFNMAWAWVLGRQIEGRISRFKLLLFILIVGIVSNTAQYLASGPYFLGYSGIVVGMAGFIWMRQRQAPWEGYPLPKATSLFFFFFVLAMVALDLIALGLRSFFSFELTANIANTAHIVGGLCGIFLGKLSFFARAKP